MHICKRSRPFKSMFDSAFSFMQTAYAPAEASPGSLTASTRIHHESSGSADMAVDSEGEMPPQSPPPPSPLAPSASSAAVAAAAAVAEQQRLQQRSDARVARARALLDRGHGGGGTIAASDSAAAPLQQCHGSSTALATLLGAEEGAHAHGAAMAHAPLPSAAVPAFVGWTRNDLSRRYNAAMDEVRALRARLAAAEATAAAALAEGSRAARLAEFRAKHEGAVEVAVSSAEGRLRYA